MTRTRERFDAGWKFLNADIPGAELSNFDDSAWRTLDLPHDWSIEGPFAENNISGQSLAYLPAESAGTVNHLSFPKQTKAKKSSSILTASSVFPMSGLTGGISNFSPTAIPVLTMN